MTAEIISPARMLSVSIKAPAKINLFLRVLNRRKDNYHNLQTLFERIDLFDKITLTRRKDNKIVITSSNPRLPKGKDNLAYKAALILKNKYAIEEGLGIDIEKRIPISAGLGGGSSDCAATLLGLNRLWKLKLTKRELFEIAKNLGSDVPFFVSNNSFSLAAKRGEAIKDLKSHIRLWHILVVPRINLSTKRVYAYFDKLEPKNEQEISPSTASLTHSTRASFVGSRFLPSTQDPSKDPERSRGAVSTLPRTECDIKGARHEVMDNRLAPKSGCLSGGSLEGLTKKSPDANMYVLLLAKLGLAKRLRLLAKVNFNSLEFAAVRLAPQISRIKKLMHSLGIKCVGMSGSGPSVFGILNSGKEAKALRRKLARYKDWRTFVVRTC